MFSIHDNFDANDDDNDDELVCVTKVTPSFQVIARVKSVFGIIEPILVILKLEYRWSRHKGGGGGGGRGGGAYAASQTTVLHTCMKRLNQTESLIFVILCVLCF